MSAHQSPRIMPTRSVATAPIFSRLRIAVALGMLAGPPVAVGFAAGPKPTTVAPAEGSKPRITISKETTYLTGPLRPDGYVDYVGALNAELSRGVTPDNNAAALFWKAMGPGAIRADARDDFFKMLGVFPLPAKGDHYVCLRDYAKGPQNGKKAAGNPDGGKLLQEMMAALEPLRRAAVRISLEADRPWSNDGGVLEAFRQQGLAMKRPWSKKQFPVLAGWLVANEKPLALVAEACKRSRRYEPLIAAKEGVRIAFLVPAVNLPLDVARALEARAMMRLEEGKVDGAWEDLSTCHRLAGLLSQGPTMVEALIGLSVDGLAITGDQALLHCARLTKAQATKMRDDLDRLVPMPNMIAKLDVAERFFFLDGVATAAREGIVPLNDATDAGVAENTAICFLNAATGLMTDWDLILRMGNSAYDRVAVAYRKPTRAERKAALTEIKEDLGKAGAADMDWKSLVLLALTEPRERFSRRIGLMLVSSLPPTALACNDSGDRRAMQFDLTRLAFALAAYHADHGSYPARLAELAPQYVAKVPKDIYIPAELHYQQDGDGYLLYSVGPNGKDDGGRNCSDYDDLATPPPEAREWDDLVVRMPVAPREQR